MSELKKLRQQSRCRRVRFYITSSLTLRCEILKRLKRKKLKTTDQIGQILRDFGVTHPQSVRPSPSRKGDLIKLSKQIKGSRLEAQYEIFQILGLPTTRPCLEIMTAIASTATLIYLVVWLGMALSSTDHDVSTSSAYTSPDEQDYSDSPSTTSRLPTTDSFKVATTSRPETAGNNKTRERITPRIQGSDQLSVKSIFDTSCATLRPDARRCRRPGSSYFHFLGVPVPPSAPSCKIVHSCQSVLNGVDTMEVDYHYCRELDCFYSTARVFNDLGNILYLQHDPVLRGVKIEPTRSCESMKIPNSMYGIKLKFLNALAFNFTRRTECSKLYREVSRWNMPNLSAMLFNNAYTSIGNVDHVRKLLRRRKISAISFNNSELCDNCIGIFDGVRLQNLDTVHLQWENYDEEHTVNASKYILTHVPNVREWRWSIPVSKTEFESYMGMLQHLRVGEFKVEIEQAYGEASFSLQLTRHSNAEELHIHLNVTNKSPDENVKILLRGISSAGANLKRIFVYARSDNLIVDTNEPATECWDLTRNYIKADDTVKITCQRNKEVDRADA